MSLRSLGWIILIGGGGYVLYKSAVQPAMNASGVSFDFSFPGVTAPTSLDATSTDSGSIGDTLSNDYYSLLQYIEDRTGDPMAKNPRSSASGLYQFTKDTWQAAGGTWGNDPTKPFGGLTPSVDEQNQRIQILTDSNANILQKAGIAINNATLYAAHFLGAPVAKTVLGADPSTPLVNLVGSNVISANKFSPSMTVASFMNWLQGKAG